AGGVHVPIHATLSARQIAFQITDSGARVVAVPTSERISQLKGMLDDSSNPQWIVYDQPLARGPQSIHPWRDCISDIDDEKASEFEALALSRIAATDLATILYTSGTTGDPKGVMLTQANLVSNTLSVLNAMDHQANDLRLSMLPWSHIFARTCDIYSWLATGCRLAIAESREKILDHCQQLQPTLLNSVPYFYEKLHNGLKEKGADKIPGSLQSLLGGRMRLCCSGGAALPGYVEELFQQQEMLLLQGYGLTETSPVITLCSKDARKIGTVGRAIKDVEVRIAEDGEVLTRGANLMAGYHNNLQATTEVIRDGWLHTGDLGSLDSEGYLTIIGRKKEMIVLSTGKNVAPVNIELRLTADPLIFQAIVLGEGLSHLTALIVPDPDRLRAEIIRQGIQITSRQQALGHPQILQLYRDAINGRLEDLAPYEQIANYRLLDRGFSVENEELTPTLKLRRRQITEHFADTIEEMYA
ncbi:MAG: AMP-dependent synthetase/ligase, partial [Planctomycetales bacterium]